MQKANTTSKKTVPQKKEAGGIYRDWLSFEIYKHYDPDLEEAVLGICLLQPHSFASIRRFLRADMFYLDFHKSVFRAMTGLFDEGLPIDILTVINYIFKHKDDHVKVMLETKRNIPYEVARLTNAVVQDTHLEYWAYLIREQYIERQLLILTTSGLGEDSGRQNLQRLQDQLDELLQFRVNQNDWMELSDLLVKLYQHMQEVEGKDIIGVPFGFTYLDQITSGISPGLYYLGARPSVGKTAFAIAMILMQAVQGIPVGIISLETPGIKLAARVLSMISGTDFWRIWRSKMTEELQRRVFTYTQAAAQLPIYISDQPAVTLSDIRAKTLKAIRLGAKVIYLDYVQLVVPDEGAGTREQEVARLSRGLKLLSMQTNIPIIALAQLSRESERRQDKTPRLIDLRESGSIEQDADGVMLLHRPEKVGELQDADGNSTKGKAMLIIAKWRDGETFEHPMLFNGDRMQFTEDEVAIEEKSGWDNQKKGELIVPTAHNLDPDQHHSPRNDDTKDDLPF